MLEVGIMSMRAANIRENVAEFHREWCHPEKFLFVKSEGRSGGVS